MGSGHHHGPPPEIGLSRIARVSSTVLLAIVAVVTVFGVVWLWPGQRDVLNQAAPGTAASVAPIEQARVTGLAPCPDAEVVQQGGSIQHTCQVATVQLTHPTILREYTSVTNATYANPDHVAT